MPTGAELREAERFLKGSGYSVQIIYQPAARATWLRADGSEVPGKLPVDPYHMGLFRKNGWTLKPLPQVVAPVEATWRVAPTEEPAVQSKSPLLIKEERAEKSRANLAKARAVRAAKKAKHQEVANV